MVEPTVLVGTRNPLGAGGGIVAVTRSATGVWESAVPVSARNVGIPSTEPPAVAVRPGGTLATAWRQVTAGRLRLSAAGETAVGGVWRAPVTLSPVSAALGAPVLATAPGGRTILAYAQDGHVFVRSLGSAATATKWSAARKVSGTLAGCISPSIAFDPSGAATVAFACGGGKRLVTVGER